MIQIKNISNLPIFNKINQNLDQKAWIMMKVRIHSKLLSVTFAGKIPDLSIVYAELTFRLEIMHEIVKMLM